MTEDRDGQRWGRFDLDEFDVSVNEGRLSECLVDQTGHAFTPVSSASKVSDDGDSFYCLFKNNF